MIVFKVDQMVIFQTDVTLTRVSLVSTRKLKKVGEIGKTAALISFT